MTKINANDEDWAKMRTFDYSHTPNELLTEGILSSVAFLHEHKGRQALYIKQRPAELEFLREVAKIQSTESSNRIEGILTTENRLAKLLADEVAPRNRDEQEILGYRNVLSLIHESYDAIDVTPNVILQLHRDLFRATDYSYGGKWKDVDNSIVEIDADGNKQVRFQPLPAIAVPDAMESLCKAYNEAVHAQIVDPLLLAAMFTFDFVCIHPFNDGNGRMSRLLTLLLLYRSGYLVGKYVSVEHEIEKSKDQYYEALRQSSFGWSEGAHSYLAFAQYLLGCLIGASRIFEERLNGIVETRMSKPERIEAVFKRSLGNISKSDILTECPDISPTTANRTLADLLRAGKIQKIGGGRGTKYRWIRK